MLRRRVERLEFSALNSSIPSYYPVLSTVLVVWIPFVCFLLQFFGRIGLNSVIFWSLFVRCLVSKMADDKETGKSALCSDFISVNKQCARCGKSPALFSHPLCVGCTARYDPGHFDPTFSKQTRPCCKAMTRSSYCDYRARFKTFMATGHWLSRQDLRRLGEGGAPRPEGSAASVSSVTSVKSVPAPHVLGHAPGPISRRRGPLPSTPRSVASAPGGVRLADPGGGVVKHTEPLVSAGPSPEGVDVSCQLARRQLAALTRGPMGLRLL